MALSRQSMQDIYSEENEKKDEKDKNYVLVYDVSICKQSCRNTS